MNELTLIKARADDDRAGRVRPFLSLDAILDASEAMSCEPSPAELEAERLQAQIAELEAAMARLDSDWHEQFDARLAAASTQIGKDHRDDDTRRIDLLDKALMQAHEALHSQFLPKVGEVGVNLARHALSRFAALKAGDAEWLADVVAKQIDQVGNAMTVALQLHPEDVAQGNIIRQIGDRLPAGCSVDADTGVKAGTARLRLRLGHIDIDPVASLGALIAAMAPLPEADDG